LERKPESGKEKITGSSAHRGEAAANSSAPRPDCLTTNAPRELAKLLECACLFWRFLVVTRIGNLYLRAPLRRLDILEGLVKHFAVKE